MADAEFTTEELSAEKWAPIAGFEGRYSVSSLGNVRSERRDVLRSDGATIHVHGSPLRTTRRDGRGGYLQVTLRSHPHGRTTSYWVHRLVVQAFVGPIPEGMQVDHINFNRVDNRVTNLRVLTPADNSSHSVAAGRRPAGAHHPNAKLSEADVADIFRMRASGMTCQAIAIRFGVSQPCVSCVITGATWKHLGPHQ